MPAGPALEMGDPNVGHNKLIVYKERERDALLKQAGNMIEESERRGRPLSIGEDSMVLVFVKKAQALEHEITSLHKGRRRAVPSKHGVGRSE